MQLTIDKLIYGGDGLGRLPADEKGRGKAVFLPFVLEGERVEATIGEQRQGFARARLDAVVEPSPHRVEPSCPYFMECGGCHYQHAGYEHQLEIKKAVFAETLRRTAKLEVNTDVRVHPSAPWLYRNRTRMRVARPPGTGEFKLGYNRFASHELLAVEQCPISSPLINRVIAVLWEMGRAEKIPPEILEIEFFVNAEDDVMLLSLSLSGRDRRKGKSSLPDFASELRARVSQVSGIAVFQDTGRGTAVREGIPPELQPIFGADHIIYATNMADYRVSAGSFFQTNRFLTVELVETVTSGRNGRRALDLYAGTGLFSVVLARSFAEVVAVESAPSSFDDLKHNSPGNATACRTTTEQFLASDNGNFDLIVLDPPRAGLEKKAVLALAATEAPRITYVSCDPASLARDLAGLLCAGYRVEEAHLVDLFPQTFHIESVIHLVR